MAKVSPYLRFNSNCEEAFNFYRSNFGGEFGYIGRMKEMPAEFNVPESENEKIMHISLPIGDTMLMGEDASEAFGGKFVEGNNFTVSITADNEAEARKLFDGLSAGGKVTMPLDKTFWGSLFGMLTDKFGINWMVSADLKKES